VSFFKSIPARPNCIYCGKPVADEAWDEESQGWFSYGPNCMLSHPNGRYGIKMIENGMSILWSVKLTTMARAKSMADHLTKSNPQFKDKITFEAVDLGKGIVNECKSNHH
jgi:hypothetical protein